ncbi:MAG: Holliday junction resolvase RuvX [Acidimicrobiia bacterium]|nr:Holliday junction resolvase RuvX [Acidimicrobiia bacterium]MBV9041003.1 Holliday junction resolvase RuvX [Acidimicrobiia bacterium]
MPSGRVLGLDLGTRRIGVAVSAGTIATPHSVLERSRDRATDHAAIAALVDEVGAERVVVGLPLSLDGKMGPAATAAAEEAAALGDVLAVPVETYDERLTTVTADRSLSSLGLKGQARRRVVDKVAAAVILQAWLDRTSS